MMRRFTEASIRSMQPGAARREEPDRGCPGLYLILQAAPSNSRSWAVRYRVSGQSRKLTLGAYPGIGLNAARRLARMALGKVSEGADPAAAKARQRLATRAQAAAQEDLIENFAASYIERYAKPRNRNWRGTERLLGDGVSTWRGRHIADIKRTDAVRLLDEAVARAPVGVNRVSAAWHRLFNWAIERGVVAVNPFAGLKPSPEFARERALAPFELKLVLEAVEILRPPYGDIVKLLALTGARRGEISGLRWSELAADCSVWVLPKERAKNKREHVVPLAPEAASILLALPRGPDAALVFTGTPGRAPTNFSEAKEDLDLAVAALNGKAILSWRLHDLRRSAASQMAALGVAPHVVEACLGHRSGIVSGIASVYNRYSYLPEKKAAFELWARRLTEIVSGEDNVVVALRS